MRFQQVPKLQERGGIRRRFPGKVDTDKSADGLAVVQGILEVSEFLCVRRE